MKKFMMLFAGALMVLAGASCQKINDLESRVTDLESTVAQLKSQVDAGAVVTKVEETATGYSLTLSNGKTYNVTNGAKGDKGDKGEIGPQGPAGADGDAFFANVTVDTEAGTVTLEILNEDGTTETIVIPMYVESVVKAVKSIKFVPEYSDGKAVCTEKKDGSRTLSVSFDVRPAAVAPAIASKEIVSLLVNAVATKAAAPSALEIATVEESNGIITVTADATAITAEAFSIALVAKDAVTEISSDYAVVAVEKAYLEYAGVKYNTGVFGGNTWMTENLRYLPEGYTLCSDPTVSGKTPATSIYYPGVITGVTDKEVGVVRPATDADTEAIAKIGYYYNAYAYLGVDINGMTDDQLKAVNGIQGVCPDGWHIPTWEDCFALVGATAKSDLWGITASQTNTNAALWDPAAPGKNGATSAYASIQKSEAVGFNFTQAGCVAGGIYSTNIVKTDNTTVEAFAHNYGLSYLACSTIVSAGKPFGIMTTFTTTYPAGRLSLAGIGKLEYAVSVRCVKNK